MRIRSRICLLVFLPPFIIGLFLIACAPSPLPSPTPTVTPRQIEVIPLAQPGKGTATDLAWSPDGSRLAVASTLGIDFYDAQNYELLHQLSSPSERLKITFTPDDQQLISWSELGIYLWNTANDNILRIFEGRGTQTTEIAVSPTPDKKDFFLATGGRGIIRLWIANTGLITRNLRASVPESQTTAITFSADGTLLAAGFEEGNIDLWNVQDGTQLANITVHHAAITGLSFLPDGKRLLTCSADGQAYILDMQQDHYGEPLGHLISPVGPLTAADVHPDGHLVAVGTANGTIAVFSPDTCSDPTSCWDNASIIKQRQASISLSFSPDGHTLASLSQDSQIQLWQIDNCPGADCTIRPTEMLNGYRPPVNAVSMWPDGQMLIVGHDDGRMIVWQKVDMPEEWVPIHAIEAHAGNVLAIAISGDGRRIISAGDDNAVRAWQLNDNTPRYTIKGHAWQITDLGWSPDDTLIASASCDKTVKLWSSENGQAAGILEHPTCVRALAFSPDGVWLATGADDGIVRVWERATGEVAQSWKEHESPVWRVAWSPDGQRLASGDDKGMVLVWSREADRSRAMLRGAQGRITGLSFSADGSLIIVGSSDRIARIWQVDGSILLKALDQESAIRDLALSSDGQILIVGLSNGTIRLWRIEAK